MSPPVTKREMIGVEKNREKLERIFRRKKKDCARDGFVHTCPYGWMFRVFSGGSALFSLLRVLHLPVVSILHNQGK